MLSKKQEQRSFSNGPLRDQWEKRAQSIADECKQEAQWREKSALKVLFSKWTYHWSLVSNGDKMKDEMSAFSKLTSRAAEENNKPKIKFKIVPPPPKPKTEPPPPPPSLRKKASLKPRRPKRKVEVDVFQLCWRESWMSLKPPKYLYLKAKELETRFLGFTNIELTNSRKYKAKLYGSEAELTFPYDKWSNSWKQVKSPAQLECCQGKQFQWEILFKRQLVWEAEIEKYSLPAWAGTWKIMNFAFRQQKQKWDRIWPRYQQNLNKSDKLLQLEEQDDPLGWDSSWQLSGQELELKDATDNETLTATCSTSSITVMVRINDVFLPSWSDSWLLSAACLEKDEEYQRNWCTSWGYRQQIMWHKASLKSHHQHSNMLTRRRKTMNLLLTSHLDDNITDVSEWMKAWSSPKECFKRENEMQEEEQKEVEQMMNYTEEDEDERVDKVENVEVGEEEEEKDEDVDEEEEEGEEGDEEEDEREEDVNKNEEDKEKRDEEVHKKEDKENNKLDEEDEEDEEEDERVDEEEEEEDEEDEANSEEKDKEEPMLEEEDEEEDEVNEKDEDIEVEEEENKGPYEVENSEEEDEEEDRNINKNSEEEEVDEDEEDEELDMEVKKEVGEKDEEEKSNDEEELDVEDDQDVSKMNREHEVLKKEEADEEEDEELDVEVKNEVDEKDEEEENDDEEELDVEDDQDVSKMDKVHNIVRQEDEEHEEEGVKGDEGHEKVDEKATDNKVEKEKEVKKLQKQVRCKPNVPLHLQFHKLNAAFSSWKKSWMVAVAHRGGEEEKKGEEEDEEEKEDWGAWKESWRICRWRRPDIGEVTCLSTEHRCQRYMGLMHEEDSMPRSEWTLSWKIKTAVKEEESEEEEEEEDDEEEEGES